MEEKNKVDTVEAGRQDNNLSLSDSSKDTGQSIIADIPIQDTITDDTNNPLEEVDVKREAAIFAITNKEPVDNYLTPEVLDYSVQEAEKLYNETSDYLKQVFTLEAKSPQEALQAVSQVEEDTTKFNSLPKDAKIVIKNHDGDLVTASIEQNNRELAKIARDFNLVDDEGSFNYTELGKDFASEIIIPDTAASNIYFSKDFLESLTGKEASMFTSIKDLRDYYRSLDLYDKMVFNHKLSEYLRSNKDILNGLEAIYLYSLITRDTDFAAAVGTTIDGVGDTLQVLGWIPLIGAGAFAIGAAAKGAVRARKLSVLAKQVESAAKDFVEIVAKQDPKTFAQVAESPEIKAQAEKLGLDVEDVKKAVSAISDIKDPQLRAELISENLKTRIALNNIETVINKDRALSLNEEERADVIKKAQEIAEETYGDVVTSVLFRDVKADEAGNTKAIFNVYRQIGEEGGKPKYKQADPIEVPITLSDITGSIDLNDFTKASVNPVFKWVASPVAKTKKGSNTRDSLINSFRENIYSSNIIENYINKRFQQIAGTLSGKSRERFSKAIYRWTVIDEVPTIEKLMDEGLTKKEALAVRKYFDSMDILYKYADKQMIAEAASLGFLRHDVGIVKPFENKESAIKYFNNRRSKYGKTLLIETEDGLIKKLKVPKDSSITPVIEKLYEDGYVLTRSKDLIDAGEDAKGFWLLTKQNKLKSLPSSGLLQKVRNYTPLVVDDATAIIVKKQDVDVGGTKYVKRQIIGYTDTIEDMQYAEKFYKGKEGVEIYRTDHQIPSDIKQDIVDGLFTGKYRSERTEGKLFRIKFEEGIPKKVKPNYQDPLQAAAQYTRALSRDLNFAPKLLEEQKRFLNTLYLHTTDKSFEPSIEYFNRNDVEKALKGVTDQRIRSKLETAFEQVAAASNIAQDTKIFDSFAAALNDVNMSNTFLKPLSKLRRGIADEFKNGKIASTLKAFTALMYLGMYNPRQFIMQASNIQNIIAISPVHGMKAVYDSGMLGMFDLVGTKAALQSGGFAGRFAVAKELLNKSAKLSKKERDFYDVMMSVWAKTGLRENIMANSDFFDVSDKITLNNLRIKASSTTARVGEKIAPKSALADPNTWYSSIFDNMFIYKAGESWNRRVAFATAFREAVEKYGLEALLNENSKAYKFLVDRAHTLLFNMDVANRAPFQIGQISSTIFMFYQVATKIAEAFLGHDLTTAEKLRLFSSQLILWGRKAVVPSRTVTTAEELDPIATISESFGVDKEDAETIYSYGLMGLLSKELFGRIVDLSETSSLQAALIGNTLESPIVKIADFFLKGEAEGRPMVPAIAVGSRVYDALDAFLDVTRMKVAGDIDIMTALELVSKNFASIPSSGRNMMIASAIIQSGIRYSATGNPIYYVPEDQKAFEAVLATLGITPEEVKIAYQFFADEREHKKFVKEASKEISRQIKLVSSSDKAKEVLNGYIRMLSTYPEATQREIIEQVYNEISKDTALNRALKRSVADRLVNMISQLDIANKKEDNNED